MLRLLLPLALTLPLHPGPGLPGSEDPVGSAEPVRIGALYPTVGTTAVEGRDQWRGAQLAVRALNREGGVLGRRLELVGRNSVGRGADVRDQVDALVEGEGCRMVFGGTATKTAMAAGEACAEFGVPFFGTQVYGDYFTVEAEHRFAFRECNDATSAARALAGTLAELAPRGEHFFVTADTAWGHATESALRRATGTTDLNRHRGLLIDFPDSTESQFRRAFAFTQMVDPDVLVLVLFGRDLVEALEQVTSLGMKEDLVVVVPQLTLGMAEACGPEAMEGVLGVVPWCWRVPYAKDHPKGRRFVEEFADAFERYPSSAAASAYTVVRQWAAAVQRAGTFEGTAIVEALEQHTFRELKDPVTWRRFDHQAVQSLFVVRGRAPRAVRADRFQLDVFEVLDQVPGPELFRSQQDWQVERQELGLPPSLGPLEGPLTGRAGSGRRLGPLRR